MEMSTTRRQAIFGIACAGAAVSAAAPLGALPSQPDRRTWDRAMAQLASAQAESDALADKVEATNAAFIRARDSLPHFTTERIGSLGRPMTTANDWDVAVARSSQARLGYLEDLPGNFDQYRAFHELIRADDERKAKLEQIDQRLGWSEINDRYDALSERITEAERVLLDMPAPDGEALMWKVQRLFSPADSLYSEETTAQTHSDLRRFLLNGRA